MRSDLHTLKDAFTELERRADAFDAPAGDQLTTARIAPRSRLHLVAASAAAVLVLAGGSAWLAQQGGSTHPGVQAAASQPPEPTTPDVHSTSGAPAAAQLPATPAQLADRFEAVLAGAATFTVTDTGSAVPMVPMRLPSAPGTPTRAKDGLKNLTSAGVGAAIFGQLTKDGATGGFGLQWFPSTPGTRAQCDDPDRSTCQVQQLADGSSLATGSEPLSGSSGGVTYQVDLIRPDGTEFLMHVSNERDPKGLSPVLAAQPPLTIDAMVDVVTSPLWGSNGN